MSNESDSRDDRERESPMLLPQIGLFADTDSGAGSIALSEDFYEMDLALQLKIIRAWQSGLQDSMRRGIVRQYRRDTEESQLPLPERIAEFRARWALKGITLPADFALMLQLE